MAVDTYIKIMLFMISSNLVGSYQCFWGNYCLLHEGKLFWYTGNHVQDCTGS